MLLNDSKWPAHVTVSQWFFKQTKNTSAVTSNRSDVRKATLNQNVVAESACSQPPLKLARSDLRSNTDSDDETSMDETIIVEQSSSTEAPDLMVERD